MEAKLIIIKGKANKAEVALKLPCTIGRSREADLTIAHPMVSRQHCQVFEIDGLLKIRDLGSLNGTFLGDQQIQEAEIYPNTEFSIGPLTFRAVYEYTGPAGAEPRFTPAVEPSPADAADVPDFQPDDDEPPPAPPPLFGPLLPPVPEPDAEAAAASGGDAALGDGEPAEPPVAPMAAPPPASPEEVAEQYAADALAEEDDVSAEADSAEKAADPSTAKRGWWPFGSKSKAVTPSPEADDSSEDESTLPADAEAASETPRLPERSEEAASTEPPGDDDLDQFFKELP